MKMLELQEDEVTDSTRKSRYRHLKCYLKFCIEYSFKPLPATPYILALFAVKLSEKIGTVSTISGYISSVIYLHKLCGFQLPDRKHIELKSTLTALKRRLKHRLRRAAPITPDILLDIRQQLDLENPLDAMFWAMFLVSYYLLVRASNVTPKTSAKFDVAKQLTRGDIFIGNKVAAGVWHCSMPM